MKASLAENYSYYIIFNALSSALVLIDGFGVFVIPIVFGIFILLMNWHQLRAKFSGILYPISLFLVFFTSGGAFFLLKYEILGSEHSSFGNGIWASFMIIFITWIFFKIKIKWTYFVFLVLTITIPYFIGLDPAKEFDNFAPGFYFLYNLSFLTVLFVGFNHYEIKKNAKNKWFETLV